MFMSEKRLLKAWRQWTNLPEETRKFVRTTTRDDLDTFRLLDLLKKAMDEDMETDALAQETWRRYKKAKEYRKNWDNK
jgi:hypothetical protein